MSQSDQNQTEELYAVVVGSVQGVGFRYFVVKKAQHLGLHGYVRNETNGDVEVVAQGTRPALEYLLMALRQGPPAADAVPGWKRDHRRDLRGRDDSRRWSREPSGDRRVRGRDLGDGNG